MKKGFKLKLKRDIAEAMEQLIDGLVKLDLSDDDDKLLVAALVEMRLRLYDKLKHQQGEYTLTLTNVEALALRIFFCQFIANQKQTPNTAQLYHWLQLTANEVHRAYA